MPANPYLIILLFFEEMDIAGQNTQNAGQRVVNFILTYQKCKLSIYFLIRAVLFMNCPVSYKCGWWRCDLLFITGSDDGYSLVELLERFYPVKAKLFDCDMKVINKDIKEFNKKNKYIKYKVNGEYLERLS